MNSRWVSLQAVMGLTGLVLISGCTRQNKFQWNGMWNESRLKPYEASPVSGHASTALPIPAGTVARGQLDKHDPIQTGRDAAGKLLTVSPLPVTPEVLKRGQERYGIYCAPCHSGLGDGNGMIAKRGFPHPPDYALARLRRAPIGHFYDVITNGYGVMYSYAGRVPTNDRWAIASYLRVLQEARPVVTEDRYEEERKRAREMAIPDPNRPGRVKAPEADAASGNPEAGHESPAGAASDQHSPTESGGSPAHGSPAPAAAGH